MTAHLRPALVNDYIWSAVSTTWKTPREGADQSTAQMSPASTASNTLEKPQVAPAPDYSVLNTDLSEGAPRQLHEVPTFTSALEKRQWAKQHMAGACRMFARLFPDGASGHISLRDPVNPSCFWINPYGVHFAMISLSDLVLVNEAGQPVQPTEHKVNTADFIIHSTIHKARPDIHAACHVHAPYGRAWSTFGRPIEMLNQDSCIFYDDLSVYKGFSGVVLTKQEGESIAKALGKRNKNVILQNYGILTCGSTVAEAAALFITLERACQTQLMAESAAANGLQKQYVGNAEAEYTKKFSGTPACMYMRFLPEYNLTLRQYKGDFLQ